MKTELEALETLQTEVSEITGNIDAITTKLNDVDGKLAALESTLAELEKIATGDHGTIDKIQQALADVNKALEDLQGIEDHTRLEALESAAERVDTALAAIGAKLDAIDPEEIGANKTAIEGLGESLAALQETVTALGTDNDTTAESVQAMNTSLNALSEKVVATESKFAAAESAIGALQSAVVALQQANASNEALQAELNALKSEIGEEDKASGWQTATTVIAIVGLVCNAGLVTAVIFFERKHHVIVPILKNGYNKVASKLKKSK
jgi:chromosome segregation ATPase